MGIAFPIAILPIPQADYSAKTLADTADTVFTSGRPRRRRMTVKKYYRVRLVWLLTPEEYDYFIFWWENQLLLGTEKFSIDMATGGLYGVHEVLLLGDLDIAHVSTNWRVSSEAVLFSKPELTAEYAVLVEELQRPDGLVVFLSAEDTLNTTVNLAFPEYL